VLLDSELAVLGEFLAQTHDMHATTSSTDIRSLRSALHREHVKLDALFDQLLAALDADATDDAANLWSEFDTELRAHLAFEEGTILPAFSRAHPSEAAQIRREHTQIRDALLELGIDVDLHAARADMVGRFIELLRRHVAREDSLMYRWSDENLEPAVRSTVLERLLVRLKMMPPTGSS
jgi:hemerythrin-like domain-containing protein